MALASCEPSSLQGSAILGENILSKVAFSAGSGHTVLQRCQSKGGGSEMSVSFVAGRWHGELGQGSCWLVGCRAGIQVPMDRRVGAGSLGLCWVPLPAKEKRQCSPPGGL